MIVISLSGGSGNFTIRANGSVALDIKGDGNQNAIFLFLIMWMMTILLKRVYFYQYLRPAGRNCMDCLGQEYQV